MNAKFIPSTPAIAVHAAAIPAQAAILRMSLF
jgi:hypothetical protein